MRSGENNRHIVVVGAGVVGLCIARRLQDQDPYLRLTVIDKESAVAAHQTGHNSGVLHSGIYYKPGSLKAALCLRGHSLWQDFCRKHSLPIEICGKVIVATHDGQLPALAALAQRGIDNGIPCRRLVRDDLLELEPFALGGIAALHVPTTGIIDYAACCGVMAGGIQEAGGSLLLNTKVLTIREVRGKVQIQTSRGDIDCDFAINCAGLYSDKLAQGSHGPVTSRIIPFRGEYYSLTREAASYCRNLIYPLPEPGFPFLGVHLTRMVNGGVECGPNAVLAYAREGYTASRVNLKELMETLTYPGFRRLARHTWRRGFRELWMSLSKRAFLKELQKLVPDIREKDLEPAPAGVRAQAVDDHGNLVDDFLFRHSRNVLHVLNAPSPAATAAPAIAEYVVASLTILSA